MNVCPICSAPFANGDETVSITQRGAHGINNTAKARQIELYVAVGTTVHVRCRKSLVNAKKTHLIIGKKRHETVSDNICPPAKRRSQSAFFDYSKCCLFCGQAATVNALYSGRSEAAFLVRTTGFQNELRNICTERQDDWSAIVNDRMEYVGQDLHAADAIYHQICSVNFRTGKKISIIYQESPSSLNNQAVGVLSASGRPVDEDRDRAFQAVVENLVANSGEQISISELVDAMSRLYTPSYSVKYMKQKLQETLGEGVVISNINGKRDIVTFNHTAAEILQEFYEKPQYDVKKDKERLIRASAALIKSDIIQKFSNETKEFYPETESMKSLDTMISYLPETLKLFLEELIVGTKSEMKTASLGQCLTQAVRPRAIPCPIQLGLAVQLHYQYGSRFLIDTLNAHGFCSSYSEVLNFETCAASHSCQSEQIAEITHSDNDSLVSTNNREPPELEIASVVTADMPNVDDVDMPVLTRESLLLSSKGIPSVQDIFSACGGHFRQYMADNADRNPWSIDGKKSFHAMGMVETLTPEIKIKARIKRDTKLSSEFLKSMVNIHFYNPPPDNLILLYHKIHPIDCDNPASKLDCIWKVSWPLRSAGTMQAVCKEGPM